MQLKAWTLGVRAAMKDTAGTPAAFEEKHEQTTLSVKSLRSECGPDHFQL